MVFSKTKGKRKGGKGVLFTLSCIILDVKEDVKPLVSKKKSGKRVGRGKEKYMSSYVKIKGEGKGSALRDGEGHTIQIS